MMLGCELSEGGLVIKVYGHPLSTCTRKVLTTLIENQTPYEFELVDLMKGEHKQAAYTSRQPFGQVPAIEDDGFRMFESRAICRYLDAKYEGKLTPKELKAKAEMEQWISVETSNFAPHVMKFVFHHILDYAQDPKVLEFSGNKLGETLGVLDAHLAKNQFFAGGQFSLADISFMPYFQAGMMTPVKDMVGKAPNVMAWWNRVSERPSWQQVAKGH